ncbi:MAG: hypothetical protein L0Y56_19190 [Nitrospira sp.]|nr:hypothetical protein [Nitrospira sp.]
MEKNYVHYTPAVRYGHSLASLEQYRHRSWAEIEPEARHYWEENHERPWEEFEDLIRLAWEEVRPQFLNPGETSPDLVQSYEDLFRNHYRDSYSHSPYSYRQYAPAYHLGYDLGVDQLLRNQTWAEVEAVARHYWDQQSEAGSWDDVKEAVHYAWEERRKT